MSEKEKVEVVRRKAALSALRRELIRDAAKRIFVEVGLPGASMREIAKAAGCTTGAIYAQYASKEEVYADILRESLSEMAEAVEAGAASGKPGRQAEAALRAWYVYFRDRPAEFDLGFYLYGGVHPAGVGKELNRELNVRLKRVYSAVAEAMEADGLAGPDDKQQRAVAGASWIFGILLMLKTGRLKILAVSIEPLLADCFQALYQLK
ncbi:TetR/AcrR family transcriptional regulator [Burkholderia multivorans]|uniref:TetR/AcrR family transcriptional regulator n=1 Tax=Burkholderia multivorans TaxID=87883 RepID=UPI001C24940E|nr:TetR/AcrR family transcriptional regulator [Burkholderia multivorans]MBU9480669.1 TetR/AcrR family transcriptional regulator [Burkholderia multivorans]